MCSKRTQSTIRRMRPLLGTFVEIGIVNDQKITDLAINNAFSVIQTIHNLCSFHEPQSELSRINKGNGTFTLVHRHTLRVLRLAKGIMLASDGLFDCTVGGLMIEKGVLPNHGGFAISSGKADDIEFYNSYVRFNNSVKITLDGIAKGYAVDCAIATMKNQGVNAGWINAGGDLRVYGDMVLPVQRRELDGSFTALGSLQNAALASSHVSINYDDVFPGKIVSNKAMPSLGVWSVMSHFAWRADALTKVASLSNHQDRDELVAKLGGKMVYPQQPHMQ